MSPGSNIIVAGELYVVGEHNNYVTFTSILAVNGTAYPRSWGGILFIPPSPPTYVFNVTHDYISVNIYYCVDDQKQQINEGGGSLLAYVNIHYGGLNGPSLVQDYYTAVPLFNLHIANTTKGIIHHGNLQIFNSTINPTGLTSSTSYSSVTYGIDTDGCSNEHNQPTYIVHTNVLNAEFGMLIDASSGGCSSVFILQNTVQNTFVPIDFALDSPEPSFFDRNIFISFKKRF
eukprot:TRINITY_DN12850_c1_g2_i1.p1 TRINITY_DN12850_c1_g2~~TRINITY_DN12850_c1_g2_i1.p1  ORF type:complete len:231 (+),score=27.07 TRINITY_DN12850_c1_g2_i1:271-963(+)